MKTGTRVGAGRWPNSASHPDTWERPLGGTVLEMDDPRAWAGTIAFSTETPDPDAVACHVQWCKSQGLLDGKIPVLWDFGKVFWESTDSLVPYIEDCARWRVARRFQRRKIAV